MSNNGKKKTIKIIGWIVITIALLVLIVNLTSYIGWKVKSNKYSEQYVYSDEGILYYEKDNQRVYIEKIYNTNDEVIELNIPNEKSILMYCNNNIPSEGIYFDMNNTIDTSMLHPLQPCLISLVIMAIGVPLVTSKQKVFSKLYLAYVFLFAMGTVFTMWQVINGINNVNLKKQENIATATIYSELYNIGTNSSGGVYGSLERSSGNSDRYKPISYYYVNNQKYIYVNDYYEKGTLEENKGKTFDIYYDKENPNKASKKEGAVNFLILIIGICLMVFAAPFVFFKNKMQNRYNKNSYKNK